MINASGISDLENPPSAEEQTARQRAALQLLGFEPTVTNHGYDEEQAAAARVLGLIPDEATTNPGAPSA
ncbi:hypothetical protein [Kocuria sp. KH4]